jgi:hypothetical protein
MQMFAAAGIWERRPREVTGRAPAGRRELTSSGHPIADIMEPPEAGPNDPRALRVSEHWQARHEMSLVSPLVLWDTTPINPLLPPLQRNGLALHSRSPSVSPEPCT